MTENRPFALGGGASREVEILRGATAKKKDNIITKTIFLLINYYY